jgi:acetyl-CoA decarbonylase/synthase complex subunit delta
MEYTYSVMERLSMAALTQKDEKLALPMLNYIGAEIWKSKEARQGEDENPALGDPEKRGILMETLASVCFLLAGSSIVIVRHPESLRLVRGFIDLMFDAKSASEIQEIKKLVASEERDKPVEAHVPPEKEPRIPREDLIKFAAQGGLDITRPIIGRAPIKGEAPEEPEEQRKKPIKGRVPPKKEPQAPKETVTKPGPVPKAKEPVKIQAPKEPEKAIAKPAETVKQDKTPATGPRTPIERLLGNLERFHRR